MKVKNVEFYKEEEIPYKTSHDAEEEFTFMFKPALKYRKGNTLKVQNDIDGYVQYSKYIVPVHISLPNSSNISIESANDLAVYMNNICTIYTTGSINKNIASIIIGADILYHMELETIIPILYHEVAHILSPFYFDEAKADQFAVEHVGYKRFIRAYREFTNIRKRCKEEIIKNAFKIDNIKDDDIKRKMLILTNLACNDGNFDIRKENLTSVCKSKRYREKMRTRPKLRLYLREDHPLIEEKIKLMTGGNI